MTAPVQPPPVFADPVEASNYAAYVQAQRDEYGAYVADHVIVHGGVPIFNEGQAVPKSTVQAHPWLLEHVRAVAPPTPVGADRTEALRLRAEKLAEEQAAIEAELAAAEAEQASEPEAYRSMTVTQMQDELRIRGLKISGTRPEVVARLVADDEAKAAAAAAEAEAGNPSDEADTIAPEGQ